MNDESGEIAASADRENQSLSSRLKTTLYNTRGSLWRGFTVTPIATSAPVDRIAIRVPTEDTARGASKNLLPLGFGLVGAGGLIIVTALLRRRRAESPVVTPEAPVIASDTLVTKRVVAQEVSFAVPVSHDEVFVERRPIDDSTLTSLTPIGQADEVQIPLTADRLEVQKQIVVTDEFMIDPRSLDGITRVSDAPRHEEPHSHGATDEITGRPQTS